MLAIGTNETPLDYDLSRLAVLRHRGYRTLQPVSVVFRSWRDQQCPAIHSHLAILGTISGPGRDSLAGEFDCQLHFSSIHLVQGLFRNLLRADARGQRSLGNRNPADALVGARSTDDDLRLDDSRPTVHPVPTRFLLPRAAHCSAIQLQRRIVDVRRGSWVRLLSSEPRYRDRFALAIEPERTILRGPRGVQRPSGEWCRWPGS